MSTEQIAKVESTSAAAERAMDAIVAELRELRNASLAARQRSGNPLKLPSRRALAAIVEGFSTVLFPNRLGSRQLAHETIDYYVGHTLDETCRDLLEQVVMELQFSGGQIDHREEGRKAQDLVREFARGLPNIRRLIETDILAAYEGDPAARSIDEVLACYPGITAILHYRLAHSLHGLGLPLIARMIAEIAHSTTGIDIHPGAQIGRSFFIDHGTGVVIGETAVLGERVRLYHGVTLGAKRFSVDEEGALVKGNARHPIVEDEVVIYAGATILGRVTIGRGSVIGGNVWLTHSIPPGSQVSQAKLRSEAFDDGSGI
ncbi:MAG TPA: serine O-acetyltransferase EpsC [Planctomycetaceae bacterium]|jgi:serine O-acetyltransferase|nr:serine O-acetyltransferase EpsC [Planctomycetaceae bacterium]